MKKYTVIAVAALCLLALSCKQGSKKGDAKVIEAPKITIQNGQLTPEALWAFGRVGEVGVSPDNKKIVFTVKYFSVEDNKGNAEIYTMNSDGSDLKRLTTTAASENSPAWKPDGKKIGYLSSESGSMQLWEMDADGKNNKQISNIEGGIEGFAYAPDMTKVVYIKTVAKKKDCADLYKGLDKTSGRINEDLMYRHWDTWVDDYPHPFVANYDGNKLSNDMDILKDEPYESPMRPWGGIEQITWSPDSKTIAYTCRKKVGKAYSLSTNSDIYLYNVDSKKTTNITEGMMGYDQNPVFSHDGKKIAWESMERDGYEADKIRLFVYDFATQTKTDYTQAFDQNAAGLKWSADDKAIYFISDWQATDNIYKLALDTKAIAQITHGNHDYTSVMLAGDKLIGTKMSISMPVEIFAVNPASGAETQLSFTNKDLLAQIKMGKVERRNFKATDGKEIMSWVIYPPDFDSTKKYPTLLYCEGGPQSTVSQFWSYRWNFQIMAAHGYIIVAPNRRGLPGFGQAWNEQISGDYGGQCMKDYLSSIDQMCKESYVDKDRLGAVGASFGGFSVYWLAGHHEKRFKAFIAHDGMFNLEQQYLETEENWFTNWDLGGPYWDKSNKVAQNSYANSPHLFVDKWDTPILIIHGELDYRIVASQGMAAYNAAILRGIPARYLYFPDENHWVLQPQNGILWQRNFFDWLDKWLKVK